MIINTEKIVEALRRDNITHQIHGYLFEFADESKADRVETDLPIIGACSLGKIYINLNLHPRTNDQWEFPFEDDLLAINDELRENFDQVAGWIESEYPRYEEDIPDGLVVIVSLNKTIFIGRLL